MQNAKKRKLAAILFADMNERFPTEGRDESPVDFQARKQDSLIWTAQDVLRAQQYEAAAIAYDKAIASHPEHYYLQLARQHIDYVQQTPSKVLKEQYQAAIGQYGDRRKM